MPRCTCTGWHGDDGRSASAPPPWSCDLFMHCFEFNEGGNQVSGEICVERTLVSAMWRPRAAICQGGLATVHSRGKLIYPDNRHAGWADLALLAFRAALFRRAHVATA